VALTRSWDENAIAAPVIHARASAVPRPSGIGWLFASSVIVAAGLVLVFLAKTSNFADAQARLDRSELVNLNAVSSREQLLPFLRFFSDPESRAGVAEKTFAFLQERRPLRNVGALSRLRVLPVSKFKPLAVVRTPAEFRRLYVLWCSIYLGAFYVVWLAWRWRRFGPDPTILPALHLLTGIGFMLMVSLRDPLRDTLEFTKFAWGVALGCGILLLPLLRLFSYKRFSEWVYTPLWIALGLFALLERFGTGPAGNDALEQGKQTKRDPQRCIDPFGESLVAERAKQRQ